jgi:tRNA-dihydrouridine synthase 2
MINKISLAPMVRMNTLPFRLLTASMGADYVFSEEIIDKKLISCVRIENQILGTIDYVTARDYALVLSIRPDERPKFIL